MSEEEKVVEEEQTEEPTEETVTEEEKVVEEEKAEEPTRETVAEELKVQTEDLFKAINDLIREGTVRRITVMRNDRMLLDIPLVAGMAASLVFAFYLPFLSAIVAAGALLGGCTVRIERDEPEDDE